MFLIKCMWIVDSWSCSARECVCRLTLLCEPFSSTFLASLVCTKYHIIQNKSQYLEMVWNEYVVFESCQPSSHLRYKIIVLLNSLTGSRSMAFKEDVSCSKTGEFLMLLVSWLLISQNKIKEVLI